MKEYGRQDLIREIASDLRIREEVVDLVLKRFQDVAMERLVNHESFPIDGLFSVTGSDQKSRLGPNGETLPSQRRLTVKLSTNVRSLYRLQHDVFSDKPGLVNKDTWRDALRWKKEGNLAPRRTSTTTTPPVAAHPKPASTQEEDGLDNPFFDDDDL